MGVACLSLGSAQGPGLAPYLASTFFGNTHKIVVPSIPNSISEPALHAPAFIPFQRSYLPPQSPIVRPLGPAFHNAGRGAPLGLQQQPQLTHLSPGQIAPNIGGLPGASFTNLGHSASLGISQQQTPAQFLQPQVAPQRLGKAIGSGPGSSSPGLASLNQVGPGPDGPGPNSLQNSLGQALDQASKSAQFSIPAGDSPGLSEGGFRSPAVNRPRPGPGFPQRQQFISEPNFNSPIPSSFNQLGNPQAGPVPQLQSSSPALGSFNQFRSGAGESQGTLQESLGQALDQASKSAQFSLPGNGPPGPAQGANFGPSSITRQGPGFSQGPETRFPQRLDSPSAQLSSGSGFSTPPQLDLEQALTKASGEALGRAGPRTGAQLSNIGPVIPAVPSGPLGEISLGSQNRGSFGSNIFRENTVSQSAPLIRTQSSGSPSRAQPGPPLVFDATPSGSGFDRQPFGSDPKISGQRIQQSREQSSGKIFLGSTRLSETPRSSSGSSISKVRSCTKTFHEECHNEYKMVCEETFTERETHECHIVEESKCENGYTTEYEPACFQQILENCENICKRGIQPDCMPQCARSLGKTSCHKVKVVTPHTTCVKVPKEVCGNITKRVPYEKCHDVPRKVCEQVPREVCK